VRVEATGALTPTAVRELLDQQSIVLRLTVHELRRPLGLIEGYLSLIQDGTLGAPVGSQELEAAIRTMTAATREMAALIEGLAAVARQEDRAASAQRRPDHLGGTIAAAVAAVTPDAEARGVRISQAGIDGCASVDVNHLRIALVNLLSNAVRHSPRGGTVTVAAQDKGSVVRIAVTDEGDGVDPSDALRLFDPWHQGPEVAEGLGLGLWIVRQVAEWHGGRVTLDSVPGQGSTFGIVLPAAKRSE
jgi:signal transduction histidine kinase